MPRPIKYDDGEYEAPVYFTKLFIYNAPEFNNIGPVVEIIRNLDKSIITHKYGKNQQTILLYGSQYNHRINGIDLKNKKDYIDLLNGMVKFIFVFNNSQDSIADNLLNLAEKYKKCIICYSEIDSIYHFYDFNFQKTEYFLAIDVINKMKEINDFLAFQKIADLFPEIDIIPEPERSTSGSFERCIEILNIQRTESEIKKESKKIQKLPFSSQAKFISKKMTRPQAVKYEDEPKPKKNLLAQFFNK